MSGRSVSAALPEPPLKAVMRNRPWFRIALLGLAAAGMLAGLCGGLWRLGLILPHGASLAEVHGPLMISGVFGALIALERAVALRREWAYLAPLLAVLGSLALLAGLPAQVGALAYTAAAAVLLAATLLVTARQPALFTATLSVGATAWLVGNILWLLGEGVPMLAGWWLAFLVFTIGGERLEMSRLLARRRGSEFLFLLAAALVAAGARQGIVTGSGAMLFGLGLLGTTAWLLRHDIALTTIRRPGQTRFFAAAMLGGYAWLGVAGATLLLHPPGAGPFGYDAALHAVLIGFVLSMVFGHALIILPAVARIRLSYHPILYAPLILLHLSVLARVSGGLLEAQALRLVSGPMSIAALAAFIAGLIYAARSAPGMPRRKPLAKAAPG